MRGKPQQQAEKIRARLALQSPVIIDVDDIWQDYSEVFKSLTELLIEEGHQVESSFLRTKDGNITPNIAYQLLVKNPEYDPEQVYEKRPFLQFILYSHPGKGKRVIKKGYEFLLIQIPKTQKGDRYTVDTRILDGLDHDKIVAFYR